MPGAQNTSDGNSPPGASGSNLDVDALSRQITDEAPGELLNLNLNDAPVSLRIAGRWTGTLQAGIGMALTPFGAMALSGDTPFFTQQGDLTLSLWLMDRWFVEASFMDDSALNTYRAGYQGKEGETVRYVGVGNTGLDFPSFPYLDLGGDSPSSFGAYGYFQSGNFGFHSLVRYDAAAREERVFVGSRERSFGYADLSRPQRGVSFVLPDDNLPAVPVVYLQDNNGPLRDSDGRRWRLAESSEAGTSARYGLVELTLGTYTGGAAEPDGMVAVYYPGAYSCKTGDYNNSDTFLGKVQDYFDSSKSTTQLWYYPQSGQRTPGVLGTAANVPGTVRIDGYEALVIYEPGTFSPFEKQNRYLAPVNTSSQADLVKLSTGTVVPGYEVNPLDDSILDGTIQNPDQNPVKRTIYELTREGSRDRRSPEDSWPLADSSGADSSYPDLYLPGRTAFTEDLGIRFTNYSASGAYFIGTDVVPGSVQVFRNGIQDPAFAYSSSSGTVSLGTPADFSELIRISYLRQTNETRLGSLAAGIGLIYEDDGPFSGKLGLGLRWNLNSDTYSEYGSTSPGTVGLGAEAKWDYTRLKTGLTLGLGFEQPDTTGLYRAAGMEGNEIIIPLPPGNSFISENPVSTPLASYQMSEREDLIYRNYMESSIIGGTTLNDISSGGSIVSGKSGPYPAMDKTLASQILAADFEFSPGRTWTGFQTPLGLNGDILERAGKIEVPYRFMNFSEPPPPGEVTVVLQIGALADQDSGIPENPDLQVELPLYGDAGLLYNGSTVYSTSNPADFNYEARIASFTLSDADRVKLQGAKYLRLLITRSGNTGELQGRVILAPPIVRGSLWRPVTVKEKDVNPARNLNGSSPTVNVVEEIETGANRLESKYGSVINKLHTVNSQQRVLEISWEDFNGIDAGSGPGADGRISAVPLLTYKTLSFFVRRPVSDTGQSALDEAALRFILASGPSSLKHPEEIALDVKIPIVDFENSGIAPGQWARVEIPYRGGSSKVLIDGKTAALSSVTYRSQSANFSGGINSGDSSAAEWSSTYASFFLVPGASPLPKGSMAIDELLLEDSVPSYRINNGATVEYNLPGTILAVQETAVLSDLSFQAALESGASGNPFEDSGAETSSGSFGMNGRSRAGISFLGFRLSGNYAYSFSTYEGTGSDYTWSAGHGISRSFGPFSFQESFDDAPSDNTMNHRLNFNLNTNVRGSISAEADKEDVNQRRRWQASTGGKPVEQIPMDFSLDASAGINEKNMDAETLKLSNYASDWLNSFETLLPDSGSGADSRDLSLNNGLRLTTSPLGTELYFQGTSSYSRPRGATQAASLIRLDFPLNPEATDLRILFRNEREYRRDSAGLSQDFREDAGIWSESFGDALPLFFSIPFYSLFDPGMQSRMDNFSAMRNGDTQGSAFPGSSQFADRFEFSVQSAMNYSLSSFFLPRRFTFRMGRVMEQKLDTPADTFNLGAGLGFSSVNMFGAMGVLPLFNFYQGDEFSHSLDTQFIFPKGEIMAWSVRSDASMLFYGFAGSQLSVNNTLTVNSSSRIGEGSRWTNSLSSSWTVPMEMTLLGTLYAAFTRMARGQRSWLTLANLAESEYDLLRTETLEFVFEKIPDALLGDYMRYSINLTHESIVRIFGRLNLSVFGKLSVSEDTYARVFSFMGTIGTTLNLMF